jgi:hypothetical protein
MKCPGKPFRMASNIGRISYQHMQKPVEEVSGVELEDKVGYGQGL